MRSIAATAVTKKVQLPARQEHAAGSSVHRIVSVRERQQQQKNRACFFFCQDTKDAAQEHERLSNQRWVRQQRLVVVVGAAIWTDGTTRLHTNIRTRRTCVRVCVCGVRHNPISRGSYVQPLHPTAIFAIINTKKRSPLTARKITQYHKVNQAW